MQRMGSPEQGNAVRNVLQTLPDAILLAEPGSRLQPGTIIGNGYFPDRVVHHPERERGVLRVGMSGNIAKSLLNDAVQMQRGRIKR